MATAVMGGGRERVDMHPNAAQTYGEGTDDDTEDMDESMGPLEESGGTVSEEKEVEDAVLEDIKTFEALFKNISQRYRLINRIGEGTFSTVYKAEDLLYEHYQNNWDFDADKKNIDSLSSDV